MSIKANPMLIQYRNYFRSIQEERKAGNAVTGRVKKAGCFASSSYLPSAALPASMDLDVVFLPIPIIKRKWLVWWLGCTGWKRRLVQAAIPESELAFLAARAPDSQAEMNPTSTIA